MNDGPPRRVLLAATGSVASIKMPLLVKALRAAVEIPFEIKVIATERALHFFDRDQLMKDEEGVTVLTDTDEWKVGMWTKMKDPVLHVQLRDWADLIVVAPLDANTLGKLANGLCDNLVTCVLRAWDVTKPVMVCPAMNTHMWTHPFTAKHLEVLTGTLGYTVIDPIPKLLACGDLGEPRSRFYGAKNLLLGNGAMAEVSTIVERIKPVISTSV
ncbi:hypothetical protein HK101_005393 [Irineochytrium annulatum]|nr:hypothetical protein HK101_005393 [Irineochytrium annulatum]